MSGTKKMQRLDRAVSFWSKKLIEEKEILPWFVAKGDEEMVRWVSRHIISYHESLEAAVKKRDEAYASHERAKSRASKKVAEALKFAEFAP